MFGEHVGAGTVGWQNERVPACAGGDLVGADAAKAQRMLGAMAPYEGGMWFFKLTGPDALVAGTKPAFLEFLKTVKAAAPAMP